MRLIHAFHDIKTNFIFHEDLIKLLVKILDKKDVREKIESLNIKNLKK